MAGFNTPRKKEVKIVRLSALKGLTFLTAFPGRLSAEGHCKGFKPGIGKPNSFYSTYNKSTNH